MAPFLRAYVYGTEELPLETWFSNLGIGYRARPAVDQEDTGGYRKDPPEQQPGPELGARFTQEPEGLRLSQVLSGGAAQRAGLAPGDLLVAVAGERVTGANIAGLLRRTTGEATKLHYFRRDRLAQALLPALPPAADTCDLWLLSADDLAADVLARRGSWLSSNAGRAG